MTIPITYTKENDARVVYGKMVGGFRKPYIVIYRHAASNCYSWVVMSKNRVVAKSKKYVRKFTTAQRQAESAIIHST